MARPIKNGLDYFPFDIDFFEDEKIEAINGEFGSKGELATIKLLCAIYRNGYFIVWDDLLKMKLVKRVHGTSKELIEQIVLRLVKWNFFNEKLFNSDNILTSSGIQKRYLEATKRRLGESTMIYACINEVNVNINTSTKGVNVNIGTQSKVKESKVKESKEEKKKVKKKFIPPTIFEFENYFIENGFSKELANRAFMGYHVADWFDSKGNPVLNWKQKCLNVWFKEENKEKNCAKKENHNGTAKQNTEDRRQSVANLENLADAVLRAASST